MKNGLKAALFLVAMAAASPSNAVTVTIKSDVPSDFGALTKSPVGTVKGAKSNEAPNPAQTTFNLTLPDASPIETLDVTLAAGKAGFSDFDLSFDIPFQRNAALLYASIVPTEPVASDQIVREFVADTSLSTNTQEIFRINQRARILFRERQALNASPVEADVGVAYWLVQSSSALISKVKLVVDGDTAQAADKLEEWTAQSAPILTSFLAHNPLVKSRDIADSLRIVRSRDRLIRAPIITDLDSLVLKDSTRSAACARLETLRSRFEDEKDNPGNYELWNLQFVLVLGTGLKCKYHDAQTLQASQKEDWDFDVHAFADALSGYSASGDRNAANEVGIVNRVQAVQQLAKVANFDLPDEISGWAPVTRK
ncbi:Putative glucosyl-3-phosphoglycerate synthase GpgS [Mesorhizobium loti]|nr:Putative glucosyl-3-phosphoglycerate synthase GpgS [Mesorhizobium loti]